MRCNHCGDPVSGPDHLTVGAPLPDLRLGSLVVAKKAAGVCHAGDTGVVYKVYRLCDRAGWGIIFESGGYDGFSACDVECFLTVTGEVCESLSGYVFHNVRCLSDDFARGRFAPAFKMRTQTTAGPASGSTSEVVDGPRPRGGSG